MSQQAVNSLDLYKGQNPGKIEMLLRIQKSSVVDELKEHFGTSDIHELALRCSLGR